MRRLCRKRDSSSRRSHYLRDFRERGTTVTQRKREREKEGERERETEGSDGDVNDQVMYELDVSSPSADAKLKY